MSFSRRDFLMGGMAAAALTATSLHSKRARAQAAPQPRKLIIVLNYGGWDPTWSIDPKPGLPLVDVGPGSLARIGNIDVWSDPSRPNVDTFFERWGGITSIVNGLQVRSFVHTDCIKRVLTGSPSETTPDIGAISAFELGRDLPVPYLALGPAARSGQLAAITGRTGTTNQLGALVDPALAYPPLDGSGPLRPSGSETDNVRAFLEASAARVKATRGQRGYNKRRIDDFISSLDRADALSTFAREGGDFGERAYTLDLNVQIPIAVRALKEGLSHTALIQSGFNWDTHTANDQQSTFQNELFSSLDALCAQLDGEGLLDDTTVAVVSEMGRTPKLNTDAGKDHWPVTSAMLLGAGVRGDRVMGASTDELGAASINLDTGELDAAGAQLQAANFVAGILEHVGVDPSAYLPGVEAFRGFRA